MLNHALGQCSLEVDQQRRVWRGSFPIAVTLADLAALVHVARQLMHVEGPMRGIIDFTAVEALNITVADIVALAHRPHMCRGESLVIVAPTSLIYGLSRLFSVYCEGATGSRPAIVYTAAEAEDELAVTDLDFQPVHTGYATRALALAFPN